MDKKVYVLIDSDVCDYVVTVYSNEEKAVADMKKSISRMFEERNINEDICGNDYEACVNEWSADFEDGCYVELLERTMNN